MTKKRTVRCQLTPIIITPTVKLAGCLRHQLALAGVPKTKGAYLPLEISLRYDETFGPLRWQSLLYERTLPRFRSLRYATISCLTGMGYPSAFLR
jgi:hypothetical protein